MASLGGVLRLRVSRVSRVFRVWQHQGLCPLPVTCCIPMRWMDSEVIFEALDGKGQLARVASPGKEKRRGCRYLDTGVHAPVTSMPPPSATPERFSVVERSGVAERMAERSLVVET